MEADLSPALKRCGNLDDISLKAADIIEKIAKNSIADSGCFRLALSGGSTPGGLYSLLADSQYTDMFDWGKIFFFWGDERVVPPDDPQSNFGECRKRLFDKLPAIPVENIFRIKGELGERAAGDYNEILKKQFDRQPVPVFDLVLLGLGDDGHIASLFPAAVPLELFGLIDNDNCARPAVYVRKNPVDRVSLSPQVIISAKNVMLLVSGEKKRDILKRIIYGDDPPEQLPGKILKRCKGELRILHDIAL